MTELDSTSIAVGLFSAVPSLPPATFLHEKLLEAQQANAHLGMALMHVVFLTGGRVLVAADAIRNDLDLGLKVRPDGSMLITARAKEPMGIVIASEVPR